MSARATSLSTGEGRDGGVFTAERRDASQRLNLDWVTPGVAVGGSFPESAIPLLAQQGVRAVVDLREEDRDNAALLNAHDIAFLHLPTEDHAAVSQDMLDTGVAFTTEALSHDRVLVHCQEGIGRSVALALCILATLELDGCGCDPIAAMRLIKDTRACASPSPAQFEAWATWLQRRSLPRPDFDAFAAIAYRHLRPT